MSSTLVSVIIPFYNAEGHIKETILSVLAQTHSNVEVICVDDGSIDNSDDIVNEFVEKDNRVKLLKRNRLPKSGSTCRNIGALQAKGDYIIFLDADDVLVLNCIEERLKMIEGTDYEFVVFPMASFSEDISDWTMISRLNISDFMYFFASGFAAWQVTSPIWKRDFLVEKVKGFDESYQRLQDIETHLRAIIISNGNYKVFNDRDPDCFYRRSSSQTVQHGKMIKTLHAYEKFALMLEALVEEGQLKEGSKLSASILIMYLTIICTVSLLYQSGIYDYNRSRVINITLQKHLRWYDKMCFKFILSINNNKLSEIMARGIRRIYQRKFL